MAEPKKTPDLVAESLRALERYEQKQEALAVESGRPPALGDGYVLEATRDFNIEWVLVAHDPADSDRFLAVPADANFLAGSTDVELPDDSAVGSLRLRCRFATWIDATLLNSELRVGVLESAEVSRARQKWLEVGDGEITGPVLAREVDDDPEYKDWVEDVLIPARRTLLEAQAAVIAPPRPPQRYTLYRIAASVVLMLGGGLAGLQLWRLNERVQDLETVSRSAEERHREEVQELEAQRDRLAAERERLIAEHRRELEQAGAEDAQAVQELRERIVELDKRLEEVARAASVVNPVIASFQSPRFVTRGKKKITLERGASHVVLFLTLDERSPAPKYRLELREKDSDVPVWTNDRLTVMEPGEIRVGVPAGILSPGVYELELSALEGGEVRRVGEYELVVSD